MRRNLRITLVLVAVATVTLTSCEQAAVSWGPVTSSYKGKVRVEGKGTWVNSRSRLAVNRIEYRDRMPNDGNSVYVRTVIRWWKYSPGHGRVEWVTGTSKATSELSKNQWTDAMVSWGLDPDASRARGAPSVCAQMGFPVPDSCTGGGVPTFDY